MRNQMLLTDKLTRLYNRKGFVRAGEHLFSKLDGRMPSAMFLSIELAHLKFVEHALGLAAADDLLMRTADILRGVFQENAVIGRWNADQFVVLNVAVPGRCNSLMGSLNARIDAANSTESGISLSLGGHFRVFDLPLPIARKVRFNRMETVVQQMKTVLDPAVRHV
jgi:diguanylate cyclase (GGDEF)-like protein